MMKEEVVLEGVMRRERMVRVFGNAELKGRTAFGPLGACAKINGVPGELIN